MKTTKTIALPKRTSEEENRMIMQEETERAFLGNENVWVPFENCDLFLDAEEYESEDE